MKASNGAKRGSNDAHEGLVASARRSLRGFGGAQPPAGTTPDEELLKVDREWARAATTRDLEQIVSYWTDDAVIYTPARLRSRARKRSASTWGRASRSPALPSPGHPPGPRCRSRVTLGTRSAPTRSPSRVRRVERPRWRAVTSRSGGRDTTGAGAVSSTPGTPLRRPRPRSSRKSATPSVLEERLAEDGLPPEGSKEAVKGEAGDDQQRGQGTRAYHADRSRVRGASRRPKKTNSATAMESRPPRTRVSTDAMAGGRQGPTR